MAVRSGTPMEMPSFPSAHGKVQLCCPFPKSIGGKTAFANSVLPPGKIQKRDCYSRTLSESDKKRHSRLIAKAEIKPKTRNLNTTKLVEMNIHLL